MGLIDQGVKRASEVLGGTNRIIRCVMCVTSCDSVYVTLRRSTLRRFPEPPRESGVAFFSLNHLFPLEFTSKKSVIRCMT